MNALAGTTQYPKKRVSVRMIPTNCLANTYVRNTKQKYAKHPEH